MQIECYISQSCTSLEQLRVNMDRALKEGRFTAEAHYFRISNEEAMNRQLTGSPTILVDGKDIFPGGSPGFA